MTSKRNDEEHKIQFGIINWYDLRYGDELLIAVPNGGARSAATGARLKKEGVRKGVWDLLLAKPDYAGPVYYCGLFVEVKVPGRRNHKNGGLTMEQVAFRKRVQVQGYWCEVVYTTQEGIDAISRYLKGKA